MDINLSKGDEILTGKFKNHKTTVKSIGTDDLNQPTVNDKPMLKFRIVKDMPKKEKEMQEELNEATRTPEELQAQLDNVNELLNGSLGEYADTTFWKGMSSSAKSAWQTKITDLERQKSRLERRLANLEQEPVMTDAAEPNNLDNTEDKEDTITMDVPFLIRVMEFAKEDAKDDIDLHKAAEQMVAHAKDGLVLKMSSYDAIFSPVVEQGDVTPELDNDLNTVTSDEAAPMQDTVEEAKKEEVIKVGSEVVENPDFDGFGYDGHIGVVKRVTPKGDFISYLVKFGSDLQEYHDDEVVLYHDTEPLSETAPVLTDMKDVLALDITKRFLKDVNAGKKVYTEVEGLPIDCDDLDPDKGSSKEEILFHINTNAYGPRIDGWIEIIVEWYYDVKKSNFKGDYNQPPDADETTFRGTNTNSIRFYDDLSGTDVVLPLDKELQQLVLQLVKNNITL